MEASKVIQETAQSFPSVLKTKEKQVKIVVDCLSGDKVKLLVIFGLTAITLKVQNPEPVRKSCLRFFELNEKEFGYSGYI